MNQYSEYLARGWSCFPIKYKGKTPLFAWSPYQETLATEEDVEGWQRKYKAANIAVATGAVSGLVVVDIDSDEGRENLARHGVLPATPQQSTGKGSHYFFAHPGYHVGNKAAFVPGVDLRSDGGYVVVPPSIHPNGRVYEWIVSPDECELAELPEWLVYLLKPKPARVNAETGEIIEGDRSYWVERALTSAAPGNRDDSAFWLACQLRDAGIGIGDATNALEDFARRCPTGDEPYTAKEARRKVLSAWSKPARTPAQSKQIMSIMPDTALYAEERWPSPKQLPPPDENGTEPESQPEPEKPKLFVTTDEVNRNLVDQLLGDTLPQHTPFDFPCRALWPLGGFARYAWPAKMVYILGGAGFLKTTFIEFLQDNLLKAGMDFAHFGPEWTPDEMGMRGMRRYGGASMDEMAAAQMYAIDESNGIAKPRGKELSSRVMTDSLGIVGDRMNWPGRGYYIPSASISFDGLCQAVIAAVEDSRSRGRKFKIAFFDYLEIMRRFSPGGAGDAFWGERIATVLKNLSIDYGFTSVLLLQAKKGDADRVREAAVDGHAVRDVMLGAASAQGMTDQQCNLFITLNPCFDIERKLTNHALLNVCKNSMGKPGQIGIKINPAYLQFLDVQPPT